MKEYEYDKGLRELKAARIRKDWVECSRLQREIMENLIEDSDGSIGDRFWILVVMFLMKRTLRNTDIMIKR